MTALNLPIGSPVPPVAGPHQTGAAGEPNRSTFNPAGEGSVTWVECPECEGAGSFRRYRSHATDDCENCRGRGGWSVEPSCPTCGDALTGNLCRPCQLVYDEPLVEVERISARRVAA